MGRPKLAVAAACLTLGALALYAVSSGPTPGPVSPMRVRKDSPRVDQPESARRGADARPELATREQIWAKILGARRSRGEAGEAGEAGEEVPILAGPAETAHARGAIGGDVSAMIDDCYKDSGARERSVAGSIMTRIVLVGEPGVGSVVEALEVTDDTANDPELLECVRESVAGLVLDAPEVPLRGAVEQRFRFGPPPSKVGHVTGL